LVEGGKDSRPNGKEEIVGGRTVETGEEQSLLQRRKERVGNKITRFAQISDEEGPSK